MIDIRIQLLRLMTRCKATLNLKIKTWHAYLLYNKMEISAFKYICYSIYIIYVSALFSFTINIEKVEYGRCGYSSFLLIMSIR